MNLLDNVTAYLNSLTIPKHAFHLWHGNMLSAHTKHSRYDFHGQSSTWSNYDNEENYDPSKTDYRPDSFSYHHNPQGYRCDDFEVLKGESTEVEIRIVWNGCSITYGVGVPVEDVWCYQIIARLREEFPDAYFPYINLAKGGRSLDYIVRTYYLFARSVSFDMAVPLIPAPTRKELVLNEARIHDFMHDFEQQGKTPHEHTADKAYRQHFSGNDNFVQYELQKNMAFLHTIARAYDFRLHWSSWVHDKQLKDWLPEDLAKCHLGHQFNSRTITGKFGRDGLHPEPAVHKRFADAIYPQIRDEVDALRLMKLRSYAGVYS